MILMIMAPYMIKFKLTGKVQKILYILSLPASNTLYPSPKTTHSF